MKAVIQRVAQATVTIEGKMKGSIGHGFVVLIGFTHTDTKETVQKMVQKILTLRVMADTEGKMNCALADVRGEILVVSQFTLYADTAGRRPGFTQAAAPGVARELYEEFIAELKKSGIPVATGEFGAYMHVSLINDGPVTIILEI